jgi:hypothetical protein
VRSAGSRKKDPLDLRSGTYTDDPDTSAAGLSRVTLLP